MTTFDILYCAFGGFLIGWGGRGLYETWKIKTGVK